MADKGGSTGRAAPAPAPRDPEQVRNVVLVGHSGTGKTVLVEALLHAAGAVPRMGRVEDGTTVTDADDVEHKQQRSVTLGVAALEWQGVKVNLLDTPGHPDFVGEVRAGLRAADAALFVVSAADGIDGVTQLLWEECAGVGMPRAVVVTRLDSPRADFDEAVVLCQRVFGEGVLPLYLPLHDDDGSVGGVLGLLSQRVTDSTSGTRVERAADPEHLALIAGTRDALLEGIIAESEDETLMDRYLAGEDVELQVLVDDLEKAVARGHFHPVLAVSALAGVGLHELLEVLTGAFPTPLEHPLPVVTRPDGSPVPPLASDPDGPLVAEVVKTTTDHYLGRVSLVRVFSGTLRPETVVHVSGHGHADRGHPDHDEDERTGTLASPLGALLRPVPECRAGDLCTVARLSHAETGDTLSAKDDPHLVEAWELPDPQYPVAVRARSRAAEDRLGTGLARLAAEDPTVRVERSGTGQLVLWCMGEAHVDVLLDRLATRHGVEVEAEPVRVPLRATLAGPARVTGRHVKQSGGHGQYAVATLEVSPLPEGSGVVFEESVVGGAVPGTYIPSVEKGVRAQAAAGVMGGHPLVDVRVVLVDGKAHSVDSSDAAFQTAGALALREAAAAAGVVLLEPYSTVTVTVPDGVLGPVMGDLSGRRGRVLGTEALEGGRTRVSAEVPELELLRYAVDLRGISHGTAVLTRGPGRYEPMPERLAKDHLTA